MKPVRFGEGIVIAINCGPASDKLHVGIKNSGVNPSLEQDGMQLVENRAQEPKRLKDLLFSGSSAILQRARKL